MTGFILRRLLLGVPTLFCIVLLAFIMMRAAPGGPFDEERALPPEIEANLKAAYHLDDPLPVQFGRYLAGLAQGDFGPSFRYKDFTVSELIAEGLPVSVTLGGLALLMAVTLGGAIGIAAALNRDRWPDRLLMNASLAGVVIPGFVVAPMLSLVFGIMLHWLPVGGWGTGAQMVLPVIALGLPSVAYAAKLVRAGLVDTLDAPWILTARARGVKGPALLFRHALPAALLPLVSWLGPATANLLTGSVVVEVIFGLPGLGRHFVQGALNRDYTLVLGEVVLYGALVVLANLAVDIVYGLLDPRIRRS